MATEIPGLFDTKSQNVGQMNHNVSLGMATPLNSSVGDSSSKNALEELLAEKGSLGPNFVHSNRLLDEGI